MESEIFIAFLKYESTDSPALPIMPAFSSIIVAFRLFVNPSNIIRLISAMAMMAATVKYIKIKLPILKFLILSFFILNLLSISALLPVL